MFPSNTERAVRSIAILVIGFVMFLISGTMLNPHHAAQEWLPVKVTSSIKDPVYGEPDHKLLVVEGLRQDDPVLSLDWNGAAWEGMKTHVWVRLPLDSRDYASQTEYPHAYHGLRWFVFIVLAIAGLVFTIRSWPIIFYRR